MELHKNCEIVSEDRNTSTAPILDKELLKKIHGMEQELSSLCLKSKDLQDQIDLVRAIVEVPENPVALKKLSDEIRLIDFHFYRVERFSQDLDRLERDISKSADRAYGLLRDGESISDKEIYTEFLEIIASSKTASELFLSGETNETELKRTLEMVTEFEYKSYSSRVFLESSINKAVKSIRGLIDARVEQIANEEAIDSAKSELGLVDDLDILKILSDSVSLQSEVKNLSKSFFIEFEQSLKADEARMLTPLVSKAVEMFKADWRNLSFLNEANLFGTPARPGAFASLLDLPAGLIKLNPSVGMKAVKDTKLIELTMAIQEELMGEWSTIYGTDLRPRKFSEAYQEASKLERSVIRDELKKWHPSLANIPDKGFENNPLVLYHTEEDYYLPSQGTRDFNRSASKHDHFFYYSGNDSLVSTVSAMAKLPPRSPYRLEAIEILRSSKAVEILFKRLTAHVSDDGSSILGESLEHTMGSSSFMGPGSALNTFAKNIPELLSELDRKFMPAITSEEKASYGPSQMISGREWLSRNFPEDGSLSQFWERDSFNKGAHYYALKKLYEFMQYP